jgi:hypothetical protein
MEENVLLGDEQTCTIHNIAVLLQTMYWYQNSKCILLFFVLKQQRYRGMCLFVSNPTRLFFLFWSVKNYKKENNVDVALMYY